MVKINDTSTFYCSSIFLRSLIGNLIGPNAELSRTFVTINFMKLDFEWIDNLPADRLPDWIAGTEDSRSLDIYRVLHKKEKKISFFDFLSLKDSIVIKSRRFIEDESWQYVENENSKEGSNCCADTPKEN